MRFNILQENANSPFSFQLLSDQGDVLLTSGTYNSRDNCTDGIRAAIEALRDPESFGIQAGNSVALRGPDGSQLASSASLASRQAATEQIADIVAAAAQTTQYDVTFTTTRQTTRRQQRAFQRVSPEELAALYNFTRTSTGAQGFDVYQETEDQLYYFHFNDASGQPVLFGRGFPASAKRDRRIEAVIRNASIEKRYDIVEDNGSYYFTLKARNGQEIARSRSFPNRAGAEGAIAFLIGSVPGYADQYIKKRKSRSQSVSNVYDFSQESSSGESGFEKFKNPISRQHFFHFNDDQGKALLYSQGYSSPKGRDNGIKSVIRNASIQERFEGKEHNGKYYFVLRAGNRQEIAQSRFFDTVEERDRWITYFVGSISGYAAAYGVTQTTSSSQTERFTLDAPAGLAAGLAAGAGAAAAASAAAQEAAAAEKAAAEAAAQKAAAERAAAAEKAAAEKAAAEKAAAAEESYDTADTVYGNAPAYEEAAAVGAGTAAGGSGGGGYEASGEEEEEEAYAYAGDDDGGFRLWLPWIIGLLALALLLFWLLSQMNGCGTNPNLAGADGEGTQQETVVDAGPGDAAAEVPLEETDTSAGAGSTGEPPAPFGPSAVDLGFDPNSLIGRMATMLAAPDRSLPASFVLDAVSFPRHSAKLNKSAYDQVDNLAALLKAYPDLKIKFIGHIDGTEDDNVARSFMNGENITLSAVRARCLYQKFIESGIGAGQLDFEGVGASSQLVNNNTESNKQKNRRLEVIFSAL
ncbi:MAG: DUF1508 domain-containing protein [Bacteroidota bacterium]